VTLALQEACQAESEVFIIVHYRDAVAGTGLLLTEPCHGECLGGPAALW
jgi:hypothetical protein